MDHSYTVTVAGTLGLFTAAGLEVGSYGSPGTQSTLRERCQHSFSDEHKSSLGMLQIFRV